MGGGGLRAWLPHGAAPRAGPREAVTALVSVVITANTATFRPPGARASWERGGHQEQDAALLQELVGQPRVGAGQFPNRRGAEAGGPGGSGAGPACWVWASARQAFWAV